MLASEMIRSFRAYGAPAGISDVSKEAGGIFIRSLIHNKPADRLVVPVDKALKPTVGSSLHSSSHLEMPIGIQR